MVCRSLFLLRNCRGSIVNKEKGPLQNDALSVRSYSDLATVSLKGSWILWRVVKKSHDSSWLGRLWIRTLTTQPAIKPENLGTLSSK